MCGHAGIFVAPQHGSKAGREHLGGSMHLVNSPWIFGNRRLALHLTP